MRRSPSIVPPAADQDIYLVLDDFGGRIGPSWRERLTLERSPPKRPLFDRGRFSRFGKTGWWCAQSYSNPSQRRFHTGNRGNPLFSAFFSQNGEFKSKGFRFPCVLSVGFRAV